MVKWFGNAWGAAICADDNYMETPEGAECAACLGTIRAGDQGFQIPYSGLKGEPPFLHWHKDCFLREVGIKGD